MGFWVWLRGSRRMLLEGLVSGGFSVVVEVFLVGILFSFRLRVDDVICRILNIICIFWEGYFVIFREERGWF